MKTGQKKSDNQHTLFPAQTEVEVIAVELHTITWWYVKEYTGVKQKGKILAWKLESKQAAIDFCKRNGCKIVCFIVPPEQKDSPVKNIPTSSGKGKSNSGKKKNTSGKTVGLPGRMVKSKRADQIKDRPWFGGAGGDGTYQALINLIPPHKIYISLFAGKCAVRRFIRAPEETFLFDLDDRIIQFWQGWKKQNSFNRGTSFLVEQKSAFDVLNEPWLTTASWHNETLMFVDPPYPDEVCKMSCEKRYKYPLTNQQHEDLCKILAKDYRECKVIIRTIENSIYDKHLVGWYKVHYMNTTRHGQVKECAYLNYPPPDQLHDYSFLGKNFEDRRRIKVKIRRHVNRLKKLPPKERNAILNALEEYKMLIRENRLDFINKFIKR